ncbi:putative transcriptional regulator [[Actinomadura] parvosata subsp. kistnae]|uniref:PucR family transcriptional regulator n=1 Tax=[Actinomadura] parvosata TaxID=1955412 RepID=UPI000D26E604|nr:helix-turn-helix domain-containing protein [Nonomuraea sp. ATCC 55076]SPL89194.1 putative transcriptional regulator [Actinomadura parvosata subsp. kistnae]
MDTYAARIPEYARIADDRGIRSELLDFMIFLRRRVAELSAQDDPFTSDDLGVMAEMGRLRGAGGLTLPAHRHALTLHTSLTLREISELSGPHDLEEIRRLIGWVTTRGEAGQQVYTQAFMDARDAVLPVGLRLGQLAEALLGNDPAAADHAAGLRLPLHDGYLVTVVRIGDRQPVLPDEAQAEIVRELLTAGQVPMRFTGPGEFVALIPQPDVNGAGVGAKARARAVALTRRLGELTGLQCAAGVAAGRRGRLAEAFDQARQISRVAPVRAVTDGAVTDAVHQLADVFVEFGVAGTPPIDEWLSTIAERLANGPDLVVTLDAYYRNDLHRVRTAAALHIHPRTLDYRLQRARRATGLDPSSVRGIRVLSAVVTRALSGVWLD